MKNTLFLFLMLISVTTYGQTTETQLMHLPDTQGYTYEQLGYQESMDDAKGISYAYLAYKETNSKGEWKIMIKGNSTGGTALVPKVIKKKCGEAAKKMKKYIVWGFTGLAEKYTPDNRIVEHRVYFNKLGMPKYVEMHLQTQNGDGSAKDRIITKFDWPKK